MNNDGFGYQAPHEWLLEMDALAVRGNELAGALAAARAAYDQAEVLLAEAQQQAWDNSQGTPSARRTFVDGETFAARALVRRAEKAWLTIKEELGVWGSLLSAQQSKGRLFRLESELS